VSTVPRGRRRCVHHRRIRLVGIGVFGMLEAP